MAKARTAAVKRMTRKAAAPELEPLGPGLHAGWLELRSEGALRVRLVTGARMSAVAGDEVDPALLDECLRAGRMVVLCQTARGATVLGALQTTRSLTREPDGTLTLEAPRVRIRAEQALALQAGTVALRLDEAGTMRAEGDRMVIDMGSNVRVLSALVELP